MPDRCPAILVTRPEPGASDTATRIRALGFSAIVAPLLDVHPLESVLPPPSQVQAILATSANAIAPIAPGYHHLPLFAVGRATAARARAAGFLHVVSADGDASALADLVGGRCDRTGQALLLAAGKGQAMPLAAALRSSGFRLFRRAVYATVAVRPLPEPARAALTAGCLGSALFFSAETARHGVHLLVAARLHEAVRTVDAVAIGQSAAVALEALPWRRIRVAPWPNQEAMLALLQ